MSYLVLARKWRPRVFEEMVGQDHIIRTIRNSIDSGRIAHAFLFSGPRGIGKTSMARILAKALNCESGTTTTPCNKCTNCVEIAKGTSVDVQEIDGASNTGVDDVRALRERIIYQPQSSKYRVYIIDEVHMLSISAFNALLKTLEEPPPHVKFIFATTEVHKIPRTIISRCQRFDFRRIQVREIAGHLKLILEKEGIEYEEPALYVISREAHGSMRDAQGYLDQIISFSDGKITEEASAQLLGSLDRKLIYELTEAIIEREPRRCIEIFNKIYMDGYDLNILAQKLLEFFRDLMVIVLSDSPRNLLDVSRVEMEEMKRLSQRTTTPDLQQIFTILFKGVEELTRAVDIKIFMEMLLVRLTQTLPTVSIEKMLESLNEIEKGISATVPDKGRSESTMEDNNTSAPPTPDMGEGKEPNNYEEFISFVKKKRPSLGVILEKADRLELDNNRMSIIFHKNSFFQESLKEEKKRRMLREDLEEFYNKRISVNVSLISSDSSRGPGKDKTGLPVRGTQTGDENRESKSTDLEKSIRREALEDPIIKEAMSIFDAGVEEIKVSINRPFVPV